VHDESDLAPFDRTKWLALPLLFLFSSALFGTSSQSPTIDVLLTNPIAFWLRSSVVSVLFSLISEIRLYIGSYISLIFAQRGAGRCARACRLPPYSWYCTASGRCESALGAFIVALADRERMRNVAIVVELGTGYVGSRRLAGWRV